MFAMDLAESLGKTLHELGEQMDSREFTLWIARNEIKSKESPPPLPTT